MAEYLRGSRSAVAELSQALLEFPETSSPFVEYTDRVVAITSVCHNFILAQQSLQLSDEFPISPSLSSPPVISSSDSFCQNWRNRCRIDAWRRALQVDEAFLRSERCLKRAQLDRHSLEEPSFINSDIGEILSDTCRIPMSYELSYVHKINKS